MKKNILILALVLFVSTAFSQNKSIELNAGKQFSPFRAYRNHTGYEHISLGMSKDFTPKFGVLFSQSYARMYSKNTNNRTIATTTTISHYHTFFAANKINLRLSLGTGLLYLNTKCLYNDYPVKDNIYGIPVKANLAVFYKLSDKLAINLNLDTHYGFLFYGDYTLLIDDPYYYKTFFYSANVGLRYTFGNKTE